MKKAVVFDLGGTLMEFKGMPPDWSRFYNTGFAGINQKYKLGLTNTEIQRSADIMASYNPRVTQRDIEIAPFVIFKESISDWANTPNVNDIIECFFDSLNLEVIIYDYALTLIENLRSDGYRIACLTDLPNGMPDYIFKEPIKELISKLDLYVSSENCGTRKPNPNGLIKIAEYFGIKTEEILFIGDEEKDKETAANAGCKFMFINELLTAKNAK